MILCAASASVFERGITIGPFDCGCAKKCKKRKNVSRLMADIFLFGMLFIVFNILFFHKFKNYCETKIKCGVELFVCIG